MPRGRPKAEDIPDNERCNAKSKQTGERCCQYVVKGKTKCKYHGGLSAGGVSHPNFIHGRYSTVMPKRLMDNYQAALSDDKALAQREEIAVMEARAKDLLTRAESGESGALMKELRGYCNDYKKASRLAAKASDNSREKSTQNAKRAEALDSLFTAIENAYDDYRIWDEVAKVVNQTTRLRESERRYLIEQQESYTAEEVRTLMAAVANVLKTEVREQSVLKAVSQKLFALENVSVRGAGARDSAN